MTSKDSKSVQMYRMSKWTVRWQAAASAARHGPKSEWEMWGRLMCLPWTVSATYIKMGDVPKFSSFQRGFHTSACRELLRFKSRHVRHGGQAAFLNTCMCLDGWCEMSCACVVSNVYKVWLPKLSPDIVKWFWEREKISSPVPNGENRINSCTYK